ncbi:hypothetical protein MAUB1S_05312 [Mycolicibacterium aubagnense]
MGLNVEARHLAGQPAALQQPEDVFLSWLLAQPAGTDLAAAATIEIARLQRYRGDHPGPRRLAELFEALQGSVAPGSKIRQ